MEPILSDVPATHRNEPHSLLARLYREIGVSAVSAALGLTEDIAAATVPAVAFEAPGARQAA